MDIRHLKIMIAVAEAGSMSGRLKAVYHPTRRQSGN